MAGDLVPDFAWTAADAPIQLAFCIAVALPYRIAMIDDDRGQAPKRRTTAQW